EIMKTANHLEGIIFQKKQEVERLQHDTALNRALSQTYSPSRRFSAALRQPQLAVIAEIKRRSPSAGEIRSIDDPVDLAQKYCQGGASAISVLTDSENFGGSLADLRQVVHSIQDPNIAVLRKDFIIHPLQLAEAVLAGAHAVILIVRAVGKDLKFLIQE